MALHNVQLHCLRDRVIVIFLCLLFSQPILWGLENSCILPPDHRVNTTKAEKNTSHVENKKGEWFVCGS